MDTLQFRQPVVYEWVTHSNAKLCHVFALCVLLKDEVAQKWRFTWAQDMLNEMFPEYALHMYSNGEQVKIM